MIMMINTSRIRILSNDKLLRKIRKNVKKLEKSLNMHDLEKLLRSVFFMKNINTISKYLKKNFSTKY